MGRARNEEFPFRCAFETYDPIESCYGHPHALECWETWAAQIEVVTS